MKKLLLINPVGRKSGYLMSKFSTFSPLGLSYVAAVTPEDWTVKIADENFKRFEYETADLVAITAFTSNINRAYEISAAYRDNGIKVIMGGIHASMIPEEVMEHADSVLVGEVEGIWEQVISDFEQNKLSRKYIGPRVDLENYKITPRRELLSSEYKWQSVQTSRGCPFNCYFCSVSKYLGKTYRYRRAQDVLKELQEIKSPYIAFVDDNLIGYSQESIGRAKRLFNGMIQKNLKKKWWMQTSINAADEEEVIQLAAKAGCMFVFIGFETISLDSLKEMKKGINIRTGVDNYKRVVDVFHKHGIGVFGAFIIGNDYKTAEYYRELGNFLVHSGIDMFQISILTPLPGTEFMEQMVKEDRLIYKNFPKDWDKYRFSYMVHTPKKIGADLVYRADNYLKNKIYSFPAYHLRLLKALCSPNRFKSFYAVYKLNQALKKSWKNAHFYKKFGNDLTLLEK
jgi:radical SAM superfamily enzyme YgiQ (UPF0313 family)